jgi:hypothetical protein
LNTIAGFDLEIRYLEGQNNDGLTRLERMSDIEAKPTQSHRLHAITSFEPDLMGVIAASSSGGNAIGE